MIIVSVRKEILGLKRNLSNSTREWPLSMKVRRITVIHAPGRARPRRGDHRLCQAECHEIAAL
eukprot:750461-Hanusia_phi.AAC.4